MKKAKTSDCKAKHYHLSGEKRILNILHNFIDFHVMKLAKGNLTYFSNNGKWKICVYVKTKQKPFDFEIFSFHENK